MPDRLSAAPTTAPTHAVPARVPSPAPGPAHPPPYQAGDLVARTCDSRLLRVAAVHDLTAPTIDGYVCEPHIPGVRWLVDAESPDTGRQPYLPSELRTATPADTDAAPRRRQIVRRLHHASREG